MIGLGEEFEAECGAYLSELYGLARQRYGDCTELDALVQDTLTALVVKLERGEAVAHPRAFLSTVLKNRYNEWLRTRYRQRTVEYSDATVTETYDECREREESERQDEEYAAVRREIGRLIRIYREVTVRHYVHGETVDEIAEALRIPRGTVLSRLSSARDQIREGLESMEKYSQISYEPKTASIGIWGSGGLDGEPFSLMRSDIEANILILAYENPVSVRGISDTMGMPSAYLEPIIERLVEGELMGRTAGGLVYTRCFVQRYGDAFGDIPAQEALAEKHAKQVWETVWSCFAPLTKRECFAALSDKQKATAVLFFMNQTLNEVIVRCRPDADRSPKAPPERPDAGKWLATLTVYEHGQRRDNPYDGSGPVHVGYSKNGDGRYDCRMLDCQSLFGDAHWAYNTFRYRCSLQSILRFYASFLPSGVRTDNDLLYELIPEFERLCILKRDSDGEVRLDIPALPFTEVERYWDPACREIREALLALLSEDLGGLFAKTRNRVPKHVDEAAYFVHAGALGAYVKAQLLAVVNQGLLPYPVTVGKTPLILVLYHGREL